MRNFREWRLDELRRNSLPRTRVKKGREKGRSPIPWVWWELRPYERSRCAEHEEVVAEQEVPAPPGVVMLAPQTLLRNASMAQI